MDFIVANSSVQSFRLSRPGPGEKGTLTLTLTVKNRFVSIPDVTATVFADCIAQAVDRGELIVPARDAEDAPAPERTPVRRRRRPAEE